MYFKAFLVSLKYVFIGTRLNGINWGLRAFPACIKILLG